MFWLLIFVFFVASNYVDSTDSALKFDCETNEFRLDGKPYRYVAGEIHPFRIPRQLWNDRLYRMRAMGLNAAQVYIAWNFHEEEEGNIRFDGDRDIRTFIQLAAKNRLFVNLRLGPYICAEWEHGGIPWWVLAYDDIKLRDTKGPFLNFAKRYLKRLIEEIADLQYPNGPVIMAQVENEYGSYGCNHDYMDQLTAAVIEYGFNRTLLFTTDGPGLVGCGRAKGAYPTVDFGVSSPEAVDDYFKRQRNASGCGPFVNSEFYTGWFDAWGHKRTGFPSPKQLTDTAEAMYKRGASFSLYMAHGGTNFGFWSGAEVDMSLVTSYDYGSPITEAGQITENYLALRELFISWSSEQPLPIPERHPTFEVVNLTAGRLYGPLPGMLAKLRKNCRSVPEPENFEKFNQSTGYALYTHDLPNGTPKRLYISFLRDIAYVYIGDKFQGTLGNCTIDVCFNTNISLDTKAKGRLHIIVENLGRLNYGHGTDYKGIRSSVIADGKVLKNWNQCGIEVDKMPSLIDKYIASRRKPLADEDEGDAAGILYTDFVLKQNDSYIGIHTYFDAQPFGKGQLYLNGVNIGRYWPSAGPQRTLYLPGVYFHLDGKTKNRLLMINFEAVPSRVPFNLISTPIWESKSNALNVPKRLLRGRWDV